MQTTVKLLWNSQIQQSFRRERERDIFIERERDRERETDTEKERQTERLIEDLTQLLQITGRFTNISRRKRKIQWLREIQWQRERQRD